MIQISRKDKEKIIESIRKGRIDAADISFPNLIDDIIIKMNRKGLIKDLTKVFKDKRKKNKHIPMENILALSIAAKMKIKTSLTDIPYAITDAELLSELGWNIWDTERDIKKGLLEEGTIRNIVKKYEAEELIEAYNKYVQEIVLQREEIEPNIHILDCTKVEVETSNENYEKSELIKIDGEVKRGYKLGSLRGLLDNSGIIEEIVFGSIKTHDLELCKDLILKSKVLKEGDILINDRGFISREIINKLKKERKVDVYVPAKKNMDIYKQAVEIAKEEGKWNKHPTKSRKEQEIQLIKDVGMFWRSDKPNEDVKINACVVYDKKKKEYFVFLTTDTDKTAKQIIKTYELRPEIEEDYRQIKEFWKLEDFKSTKYNFIVFHIVMLLIGYMYFQIYKNTEEGQKYAKKSLPVAIKKYVCKKEKKVIIYRGRYFAIFNFLEFIKLYSSCSEEIQSLLDPILALV